MHCRYWVQEIFGLHLHFYLSYLFHYYTWNISKVKLLSPLTGINVYQTPISSRWITTNCVIFQLCPCPTAPSVRDKGYDMAWTRVQSFRRAACCVTHRYSQKDSVTDMLCPFNHINQSKLITYLENRSHYSGTKRNILLHYPQTNRLQLPSNEAIETERLITPEWRIVDITKACGKNNVHW